MIEISSDSDDKAEEVPEDPVLAWPEWAGVELSAGEIIFNQRMFYTATFGKTLYNAWMESFVATEVDFEIK